MNKKILYTVFLLQLSACSNFFEEEIPEEDKRAIKLSEKINTTTSRFPKKSNEVFYESSINSVFFISKATEKIPLLKKSIEENQENEIFILKNKGGNQFLILDFCCGISGYKIQRIILSPKLPQEYDGYEVIETSYLEFRTGHGHTILEPNTISPQEKNTIIEFRYQSSKINEFKWENMGDYYTLYQIENSTIKRIEFGFEMP
ncbi:MAG: hypothetical protein VXY56_08305 [Pseudomonadota bacterium]|nr:hypothetical protein [Pseudomonadota bacterium]